MHYRGVTNFTRKIFRFEADCSIASSSINPSVLQIGWSLNYNYFLPTFMNLNSSAINMGEQHALSDPQIIFFKQTKFSEQVLLLGQVRSSQKRKHPFCCWHFAFINWDYRHLLLLTVSKCKHLCIESVLSWSCQLNWVLFTADYLQILIIIIIIKCFTKINFNHWFNVTR